MPIENNDANIERDPSPAPDANHAAESSTAADETNKGSRDTTPSLADVARKAYAESTARNEGRGVEAPKSDEVEDVGSQNGTEHPEETEVPPQEEPAEPTEQPGEEGAEGEEAAPAEGDEEEESATEVDKTGDETPSTTAKPKKDEVQLSDADKKLPFHKHPRFVEVIKQHKDATEKLKQADLTLKAVKPEVDFSRMHNQFISQNGIEPSAVNDVMNALARVNTDPVKAKELLKPYWDLVSGVGSNSLPTDLQTRVTEGELTEKAAQEIAGLRGNRELEERRQRHLQIMAQRNQAQSVDRFINDLDSNKLSTDPSYKPKDSDNAPDGLRELTHANFIYLQSTRPPASMQDIAKNFDEAYTKAVAILKPHVNNGKRLAPKPTLSSTRSSTPPRKTPQTTREVAAATARKHGIRVGPEFYTRA